MVPMALALLDLALLAVALVLAVAVLVPVSLIIGGAAATSFFVGFARRKWRRFDRY